MGRLYMFSRVVKLFCICLLVQFNLQVSLLAQPGGGNSSQAIRSVDFSCVSLRKFKMPDLYYFDGKDYAPLKVPFGVQSKNYRLSGVDSLKLFIQKEAESGELIYMQCAEAPLVANSNQMLFLVSRAGSNAKWPLDLYGLNDSLSDFPLGGFRFVNFTKIPLEVSIREQVDSVNAGAVTVVVPKISESGGFYPFNIKTRSGVTVYQTRLYGQRQSRETVFIAPPKNDKNQLTIEFLSQVIPSG